MTTRRWRSPGSSMAIGSESGSVERIALPRSSGGSLPSAVAHRRHVDERECRARALMRTMSIGRTGACGGIRAGARRADECGARLRSAPPPAASARSDGPASVRVSARLQILDEARMSPLPTCTFQLTNMMSDISATAAPSRCRRSHAPVPRRPRTTRPAARARVDRPARTTESMPIGMSRRKRE